MKHIQFSFPSTLCLQSSVKRTGLELWNTFRFSTQAELLKPYLHCSSLVHTHYSKAIRLLRWDSFPNPMGLRVTINTKYLGLIFIWMLIVLLFIYLFKCSRPSIITSVKWVIKGRKFEVEGSICKLQAKPVHLHTLYTT